MSRIVAVAAVSELPVGERKLLEVDGLRIAVFNSAGEYYCVADVCSHDDGPVAEGPVTGCEIECPRHGARFDLRKHPALRATRQHLPSSQTRCPQDTGETPQDLSLAV